MKWLDVLKRISDGESRNTEFKRTFDITAVGQTICAFANSDGGVIVLGVDDSGSIVGIDDDTEKIQERMTSFLQDGCSVAVSANCGRHKDPKGWVHWINVPRQQGIEPISYRGRFWVRRERSSVTPSPSELQELFNAFGFVLTEKQVIRSANIDAIDLSSFRLFQKSLGLNIGEEPQPLIEDDLINMEVVEKVETELHPTLYGLMVFGKAPQEHPHTRSFWIQCAAYTGYDQASDVILVGEGKGRLDEQVHRALGWIKSLGQREYYSGLTRIDEPLIPTPALREALVNAVAHRDYAITGSPVLLEIFCDRILITSPGTLPNHLKVEGVFRGGIIRSRNESMAYALVTARLMERRGRGLPIMRQQMKEFNGTEPQLENDEVNKFVRVTFRLKSEN